MIFQLKSQSNVILLSVGDGTDDVVVTEVVHCNVSLKETRKLCISKAELAALKNNQMLTDESINIVQQYLQRQFPNFDEFFDTVLGGANGFDTIKSVNPFIQILYTGKTHWICVANTTPDTQGNSFCYIYI